MCEMHFHHYLVYKKIQKTIDSYNIVSLENQKKKALIIRIYFEWY